MSLWCVRAVVKGISMDVSKMFRRCFTSFAAYAYADDKENSGVENIVKHLFRIYNQ